MRVSNLEYIKNLAVVLHKSLRCVVSSRNGLLLEFIPSKDELPFYLMLLQHLKNVEEDLDAVESILERW